MWMHECADCFASQDGLHTWIRHLTDIHSLPTEWPSERAAKLTGPPATKPYTTITESKKRRRKDSVPRPLNSFMLFAQHIRRNVLRIFNDASNSVLSQQLGFAWRSVPRGVKNRYDDEASKLVKIHQFEFPNYKYQPKKRCGSLNSSDSTTAAVNNHHHDNGTTAAPPAKLPISRGYSPEPWPNRDSAYSTRKNSCASSSASSPQVTDFASSPIKHLQVHQQQPYRRILFEEPSRPIVRQRFASATNGTMAIGGQVHMTAAAASMTQQQQARPFSCLLTPGGSNRVLKREFEDLDSRCNQVPTATSALPVFSECYGYLGAKRRPVSFFSVESSATSLPERVSPSREPTTLIGRGNWQREEEDDFSFFESATESESILSEENGLFDDFSPMSVGNVGDLADFLPGAEILIRGVEPLTTGTLSPDLEMLDKSELLQIM